MEPVRPPIAPSAPQVAARVMPLGRGWMLLALESGAVLRNPALGVELRLGTEDSEGLRQGDVTPEALAQRAGAMTPAGTQLPPSAVTVAFSPEAMRLSGRMTPRGDAAGKGGAPLSPQVRARLRALWIGAICLALLVVVLIGTG